MLLQILLQPHSSSSSSRRGTQTLAVWPGLAKGQDAEGECAVKPCCENFCWQCRLVQVGEFFVVRPSLRWTGSWLLISVVVFARRANTMSLQPACTQTWYSPGVRTPPRKSTASCPSTSTKAVQRRTRQPALTCIASRSSHSKASQHTHLPHPDPSQALATRRASGYLFF